MREQLNWFVDFQGSFPTPDCVDEISNEPPGKELAAFLAAGLKQRNVVIERVETYEIEHRPVAFRLREVMVDRRVPLL